MEALFGSEDSTLMAGYSHSVLITLVHVETYCDNSRPELLIVLFSIGFIAGVIVNLPFADLSCRAFKRYIQRLLNGESAIPPNSTSWDRTLTILHPVTFDDDDGNDVSRGVDRLANMSDIGDKIDEISVVSSTHVLSNDVRKGDDSGNDDEKDSFIRC